MLIVCIFASSNLKINIMSKQEFKKTFGCSLNGKWISFEKLDCELVLHKYQRMARNCHRGLPDVFVMRYKGMTLKLYLR